MSARTPDRPCADHFVGTEDLACQTCGWLEGLQRYADELSFDEAEALGLDGTLRWARFFPSAPAEDLTSEDVERSQLASGMSDNDLQAIQEDSPLIVGESYSRAELEERFPDAIWVGWPEEPEA